MKTTNLKTNLIKQAVLSGVIFFLGIFLFTSCSDSDGINLESDATLIDKIESASKVQVNASDLPSATANSLKGDLADGFVTTAELASGLGYQVELESVDESRQEEKSDVFFSLEGRQLNDTDERRTKKRNRCFEFVFPIDFIMPDDSVITLNSKEDWPLIKDWYEDNPEAEERPEMVFPVDVMLKEDGTIQTLVDREELKAVKQNCRKGKDKRKCFKLVLPVSFTMPDGTVLEINERRDFRQIRAWHKENPDVEEKGSLNFPVDIEYRDGTVATIEDQESYDAAKETCRE